MNTENKKLFIIGQIDLTEIHKSIEEREAKNIEHDSTDFYCIQSEIEQVILESRPIDYFKGHIFFNKTIPVVTQVVGENYSNYFIEVAIYAAKCYSDDITYFASVLQDYWKDNNYGILTEENLYIFKELTEKIKYILKPRIRKRTKSGNEPYISINTTNFTFKLPAATASTIYPNDFYYARLIDDIRRGLHDQHSKAASLIITEFIDTYKKNFGDDTQPLKTIYDSIFKKNKSFHSIANAFNLSSEKIYDEKEHPITFSFLIALAKAYGFNIQNSKIKKVLDKKHITIFRDLWWRCELYHKYDMETWENHKYRKYPNTIREMVSFFKEAKFLELEKDIELITPEDYFQAKGRPTTKNHYDFINSNISNNKRHLNYLIEEITKLFNEKCKGKKDRGNIVGLILEAAKRLDLFKEKPSFEKFEAVFIANNTSGNIIQIGKSAYYECQEKDRSREGEYRPIYCEMKKIKENLEK